MPSNLQRTFAQLINGIKKQRPIEAHYSGHSLAQGGSLFAKGLDKLAAENLASLSPKIRVERVRGDIKVLGSLTKSDGETYITAAGDHQVYLDVDSHPYQSRNSSFYLIHRDSGLVTEMSTKSSLSGQGQHVRSEESMTCTIQRATSVRGSSILPSEESAKDTTLIEFIWEATNNILLGKLVYESADQATIETESRPRGRCRGLLAHAGTDLGSWTLGCASGITARGTIEGRATNKISGRGRDSRGKAVRFRLREARGAKAAGG